MAIKLSDYTAPAFAIARTEIDFDLDAHATRVRSKLTIKRIDRHAADLVLNGEKMMLERVAVNGRDLGEDEYAVDDVSLTLRGLGDEAVVEITTVIDPSANTELTGLYLSGGRFCTQCEAEGFRRITYFLDRPDCLSRYTVRVTADKAGFPTLLSNGDRVEAGDLENGRHYAVFEDPFLKPCYLFALVAGRYDSIEDRFVTRSGKAVYLAIHVDPGQAGRAWFAMDSLKRSMAWDEAVFEREYDLSEFHIVAVRDFNFGAMENKGLNIFNSSLLLADPDTATDADFLNVEGVVAHEYFHNWTGNRITLRDWFQLCLKEGLTVFRDQEFSSDQRNRAVQRISDVESLRARQFPEDDGPLAHPPRPGAYEEIDNFYTATVYQKGAEVVRVIRELVGKDAFRSGMQTFFDTCDGTAATLEDFVGSFNFSSEADRAAALRWYEQAGTPQLHVETVYRPGDDAVDITVRQVIAPTQGEPDKTPLPIPLRIGFLTATGEPARLGTQAGGEVSDEHHCVLREDRQTFTFHGASGRVIPAVLRGFNAPVRLHTDLTDEDRLVQVAHEPDPFTRWDAGQSLMASAIIAAADGKAQDGPDLDRIAGALRTEFSRPDYDPGFAASVVRPPVLSDLFQMTGTPDPEALYKALIRARQTLAHALKDLIEDELQSPAPAPDALDNEAIGRRALRAAFLSLQAARGPEAGDQLLAAFKAAGNMTETMAALRGLSQAGGQAFDTALEAFEIRWRDDALVMDKFFSIQVASATEGLERAHALSAHPLFTLKNPNRARALYGAFAMANPRQFHAADGSGYAFVADGIIAIEAVNPMTAARLVRSFETWRRFDAGRQSKAEAALRRIRANTHSVNVHEMIDRTLGD
ncbi:aminopeptidase N [Hyphomonadaceae bacterium BL14]|nr:aminopeptidase N [Hyphomonadaceae bacterium BL14]